MHTREKPERLIKYLNAIPPESLICCVDGFDVLCCGSVDNLHEVWETHGRKLIFGAEKHCFHHFTESEEFFSQSAKGQSYPYLNGGMFLGTAAQLCSMMSIILKWNVEELRSRFECMPRIGNNFNDQTLFGLFATQYPDVVTLDRNAELFWNLWGDYDRVSELVKFDSGGLINTGTGSRPCFIHLSQIDRYYDIYVSLARRLGVRLSSRNVNLKMLADLLDQHETNAARTDHGTRRVLQAMPSYRYHLVRRKVKAVGSSLPGNVRRLLGRIRRKFLTLPRNDAGGAKEFADPASVRDLRQNSVKSLTICAYDSPGQVGGTTSWLRRLLPALRANGIEIRCLLLRHFGESGSTEQYLREQNFLYAATVIPGTTQQRCDWLLKEFLNHPTEVFFPNEVLAGYYLTPNFRAAGIPVIGILHSDCDECVALQDMFVSGEPRYRLSAMVCVSRELESQVVARGVPDVLVARIPCGVPVPLEHRQRDDCWLKLVYVGRLAEVPKQVTALAKAFCLVAREIPGLEAVIYGEGPARESVSEVLRTEGAGLPVVLGGPVESSRIYEVLLRNDVIVLLSDYEGLPVSVMEGMACGLVPVCLDIRSGIPELVKHEHNGLLVKNRHAAFLEAIQKLASDMNLYDCLGQNARATIVSDFSESVCTEKWIQLLNHTAGKALCAAGAKVSTRVVLPNVHPLLSNSDPRQLGADSLSKKVLKKTRKLAGKWRRSLSTRLMRARRF
jgi:colanic acid/amylovoran biosynthesis glycosyltransferase